jgi:hypothetical protein
LTIVEIIGNYLSIFITIFWDLLSLSEAVLRF